MSDFDNPGVNLFELEHKQKKSKEYLAKHYYKKYLSVGGYDYKRDRGLALSMMAVVKSSYKG